MKFCFNHEEKKMIRQSLLLKWKIITEDKISKVQSLRAVDVREYLGQKTHSFKYLS